MLGYLSLDIICSSKLTVFLELRSRKTVRLSEQIMSADKYPSIFSRQMKAIVYIYIHPFTKTLLFQKYISYICITVEKRLKVTANLFGLEFCKILKSYHKIAHYIYFVLKKKLFENVFSLRSYCKSCVLRD